MEEKTEEVVETNQSTEQVSEPAPVETPAVPETEAPAPVEEPAPTVEVPVEPSIEKKKSNKGLIIAFILLICLFVALAIILGKYEKVLDFVCPKADKDYIAMVRSYLGNMNFTREEMTGNIKDLSNGTKAKLFLIKLVLDKCNVLILDEPTRNVSPLSNPVIRGVLRDFNGCIISVSHDRKYLSEVIDDLYVLTKEGIKKER